MSTDDWPTIQLPPAPTDAELEAERDLKHAAALNEDAGRFCRAPATEKLTAFGTWPRCALPLGHPGDHNTLCGQKWGQ